MEHVNGWCFRGIYKGGLWENDLHVSALNLFRKDNKSHPKERKRCMRYNPHDKMFKTFVQETELRNTVCGTKHTFCFTYWYSSSQHELDYILTLNMADPTETKVNNFKLCNTSSHVHLFMTL